MTSTLCNRLSLAGMLAYVAYVLLAKFGAIEPRLGEVGEFLLVLASIVVFVGGLLIDEADRPPAGEPAEPLP
jgi:hypothetical protein